MEEENKEYIGTITQILHPQFSGFIQSSNGDSVYFYCDYKSHFKKGRGSWQLGDKVIFLLVEKEDGKKCAHILGYIGNTQYEEFLFKATQENPLMIKGTLQDFKGVLYFKESQSKLIFSVSHIDITDVNMEENKEYEAILDVNSSLRWVSLVEWIDLHKYLYSLYKEREIIKSTIVEVRFDYLKVLIPDTPFYGKVLGFDRTKDYSVGDDIELYCFTKKRFYRVNFSDANYRRSEESLSLLPKEGEKYQAIITAFDDKYYQVEIIGEGFNGVIPVRFKKHIEKHKLGDVVDVVYCKRINTRQFLFFTNQQFSMYAKRKERLIEKKKIKALQQNASN